MLNSYKDGCLMNESYVFYSSINTFRNPIFEPPQAAEQQEGAGQLGQRQSPASSCSMSSTSSSPSSVALVEGEESVQAGDHQQRHQPTERARIPKSCSNNTSVGSNQSEPGRRWQEFCDNLSLSIRGRLFVMESNLKRRIRAMREYVDKKMPWISPLVSQKRRSAARGEPNSTGVQQAKLERGLGRFQFPEPQSAKTLEVQEERLLNRLKRIKRERQLASSASAGARASQVAIDHADGSPGSLREALPSSSSSPPSSFSSSSASSSASASASDSSEAETMASGGGGGGALTGALGPVLLETGAPPLGLFSSINEPVQANSKSKLARKRSRWISRGGRQLRDTALAFASSKKSCIVCYERPPNIVTLPCKHSDICSDCFIEIIYMAVKHSQYPLRCVLCRQKVERIRCSRRLLLSVIEKNRLR